MLPDDQPYGSSSSLNGHAKTTPRTACTYIPGMASPYNTVLLLDSYGSHAHNRPPISFTHSSGVFTPSRDNVIQSNP